MTVVRVILRGTATDHEVLSSDLSTEEAQHHLDELRKLMDRSSPEAVIDTPWLACRSDTIIGAYLGELI